MNTLLEMPKDNIEPISIKALENDELNHKEYNVTAKFRKSKVVYEYNQISHICEVIIADNQVLLESLNHVTQRVDYLSKLEINSIDFIHFKLVTQKLVWRNIHNPNVKGIILNVMLNYLLPKYKNIMCDEMQTELGMNLWLEFIAISYQKNLHVYLVNFDTKTINQLPTHKEFIDFYKSNQCPWISKENYQKYRILISQQI